MNRSNMLPGETEEDKEAITKIFDATRQMRKEKFTRLTQNKINAVNVILHEWEKLRSSNGYFVSILEIIVNYKYFGKYTSSLVFCHVSR